MIDRAPDGLSTAAINAPVTKTPTICILGLSITGNKGAQAMLLATVDAVEKQLGPCYFDLVTVYPAADRAAEAPDSVRVVSGKPLVMLAMLPVSVLLWPLLRWRGLQRLLSIIAAYDSLSRADLVLDVSGIAFNDGRGFPKLLYNLALCLPPALMGKPTVKLSQALGPFKTALNRMAARAALPRMSAIVARGEITKQHCDELGLTNVWLGADTAFVMPVTLAEREHARALLGERTPGRELVGVSPSVVVDDHCREKGIDYASAMARFVDHLHERGFDVVVLPHSLRVNSRKRMNNDALICEDVLAKVSQPNKVLYVSNDVSAPVLRALIGHMDYFVASRFHAMVAALVEQRPTLLIGWSHKYREVLAMFELEGWALPFEKVSAETLIARFEQLVAERDSIAQKLAKHLPDVVRSSTSNFTIAAELLPRAATGQAHV